MANRIKFTFINNNKKSERELLSIIGDICPELTLTNCYPGRGHLMVVFCDSDNIKTVLQRTTIERLEKYNLYPKASKTYNANRTIFVTNINNYIANSSPEELVDEINDNNENIKATYAYAIRNNTKDNDGRGRHTIKITTDESDQADYATAHGIRIGGVHIPNKYVHKERQVEVKQCFKCFKFYHDTNQCSDNKQYCSRCAKEHHYTDCKSRTVKCKNCDGPHVAIAPSCQVRKAVIENLDDRSKQPIPANDPIAPTPARPVSLGDSRQFPPLRVESNNLTLTNSTDSIWNRPNIRNNVTQQQPQQQQQQHQQQQQPTPTPPKSNPDSNMPSVEFIWNMKLDIIKSYAEMKANKKKLKEHHQQ